MIKLNEKRVREIAREEIIKHHVEQIRILSRINELVAKKIEDNKKRD